MMLHIGEGHSNSCQISLKLFGYDIFCNNLQHKNNFRQIWRYQRYYKITYVTNRRKARVMLHVGASQ